MWRRNFAGRLWRRQCCTSCSADALRVFEKEHGIVRGRRAAKRARWYSGSSIQIPAGDR